MVGSQYNNGDVLELVLRHHHLQHFHAVHFRHLKVKHHHGQPVFADFDLFQGLHAVCGVQEIVRIRQHVPQYDPVDLFILYDEDMPLDMNNFGIIQIRDNDLVFLCVVSCSRAKPLEQLFLVIHQFVCTFKHSVIALILAGAII